MISPIHLAAVQYSTGDAVQAVSQDRAVHILDDAAHTSDLVLLPMNSFGEVRGRQDAIRHAEPWGGALTAIAAEIAVVRNCHICYSIIERDGDRFYNTSVLMGANGVVLGRQRKVHLTEEERLAGLSAGDDINVFPSNLGNIAILGIEEAKDVQAVRSMRGKNAQILLVPAQVRVTSPEYMTRTLARWEKFVRVLAVRGRWCVVAANKVGPVDRGIYVGRSMVMDVSGETVARGSVDQDEVVRASVVVPPKMGVLAA